MEMNLSTILTTTSSVEASEGALSLYKYLIVVTAGWVVAQSIKCLLRVISSRKVDCFAIFFTSGGMPSSHTAVIVSVTTLIGLVEGVSTAIFGLAVAIALIVVYDAVKSRKSVGDQAELINKLLKEQGSKIKPPKIVRGHTIPEVIVGGLLGVAIGFAGFLLF